ncbi:hypothetical protein ACICHK_32845 [Streptomyces sp. AHU1]
MKDVRVVAVRTPVVRCGGSPAAVRPDRPAARTVREPLALEP